MTIFLAIVIGAAFGFVLDRTGATNPNKIVKMLNLKDLHLAKTILMAIGVGSVLMFAGQMTGLVDVGHMSVKAAYVGVFVGGLIMGFGWAFSGFCPGTSVTAAASGRKDALFFIAGGLLGAAAYMISYASIEGTFLMDKIMGGKVTLGTIPGAKYEGITALQGDLVGIALGVVMIIVAFILPDRLVGGDAPAGAVSAE
ncbi:MAG: YeeE/YedE family protein [Marinosulfonomonas sp.]|nr:YeeE/YedE family protein [Marinosulfonomonas sp.]